MPDWSPAGWPIFDEQKLREKISELESRMSAPDFWSNRGDAERVTKEISAFKKTVTTWETLAHEHAELLEFTELTDESDIIAVNELKKSATEFEQKLRAAELTLYLGGTYDAHGAILNIHVGAGGVDAADWAAMLLRMYLRYAEGKNWDAKILEKSEAEEGGLKSATVEITAPYAYGFLKSEHGTHRLVRRSPFNSAHSRETSFAKVEILPLLEDESELAIKPDEIRIDTFMAGGHGGQGVNTTYSAVRITHLATGIAVSCQNERSQQQNKAEALKVLRARLAEKKLEESEARERELRGEPPRADFGGDAIRSYILDDKRVKDRRTGHETFNPEKVLDGELEEFIRAYLTKK